MTLTGGHGVSSEDVLDDGGLSFFLVADSSVSAAATVVSRATIGGVRGCGSDVDNMLFVAPIVLFSLMDSGRNRFFVSGGRSEIVADVSALVT